jgi:hypothetical protein
MLLGYFDYLVLLGLLYLNYRYWYRPLRWWPVCLMGLVVFGVLLPFLSMKAELRLNGPKPGEMYDGFNFLYVYLRFPLYWGLFLVQSLVLVARSK